MLTIIKIEHRLTSQLSTKQRTYINDGRIYTVSRMKLTFLGALEGKAPQDFLSA